MNLPKISAPIHFIDLPVSGRKIKFRPFLVKEEKSIITSLSEDDNKKNIEIFKTLISNCVLEDDFNPTSLNIVDFVYLILFIRMKSVGEKIEPVLKCSKCEKDVETEFNLESSLKIENPEFKKKIVLISDELKLNVKPISIESFFNEESGDEDILASAIDSVVYKENIYKVGKDCNVDDIKSNVFSALTKKDLLKIKEGLEAVARLYIEFDFLCYKCGEKNTIKTYNVLDFF